MNEIVSFGKKHKIKKDKLQAIRKQKGYTQQQVADFISTDVSNYSRKESGEVRIYTEEWDKIARFLGVPLKDIYEEDEATFNTPMKNKTNALEFNQEKFYISVIKNLKK